MAPGPEPAYDADGQVRPGAWAAELTGLLNLDGWPEGMRVIVHRERPQPDAQLRFTDLRGHRFTCIATGTRRGQLADLELRHRRRARCEDRIRAAKDTGLRNLPSALTRNRSGAASSPWPANFSPGCSCWPSPTPPAPGDPKAAAAAVSAAGRTVRGGGRLRLRIAATWPWATQLTATISKLQAFAPG